MKSLHNRCIPPLKPLERHTRPMQGGRDGDSGEPPGVARGRAEAALKTFYAPRLRAANATPVLYSTWGRHDGDPLRVQELPAADNPEFQQGCKAAALFMARAR